MLSIPESNREDLILFVIRNNLVDIIKELLNNVEEYFGTLDLEIHLEKKWNNKEWVVVKIFTKLDGESASNQLELLEDELFEKYQDVFLDNILLSVEFK